MKFPKIWKVPRSWDIERIRNPGRCRVCQKKVKIRYPFYWTTFEIPPGLIAVGLIKKRVCRNCYKHFIDIYESRPSLDRVKMNLKPIRRKR